MTSSANSFFLAYLEIPRNVDVCQDEDANIFFFSLLGSANRQESMRRIEGTRDEGVVGPVVLVHQRKYILITSHLDFDSVAFNLPPDHSRE